MKRSHRSRTCLTASVLAVALLAIARTSLGYIEAPHTLGMIITQSSNIMLMRVEKVDKEKNLLVYRKVRDLKGANPDVIKHNIGRGGFAPREWQNVMAWAEVGQPAVFFYAGGAGEVCINKYWYQVYAGDWWVLSHAEPYLLRSFAGNPEKLASAVQQMLAGQEVTVPCMVDGDKNALQLRSAKIQRMKASLKIQDYNPQRDFAGWGGEDFRPIADMPGFALYSGLNRVDPGAVGAAPADIDGDGKTDLFVYGVGRAFLLQFTSGAFNDASLPLEGGANAAAWADCNGDGRPDLLLATPAGPKLFLNTGKGFKDATTLLPKQDYYNLTACAWIDYDGDGRPDILLADGYRGLRLYRNTTGDKPAATSAPVPKTPPAPPAPPVAPPGAAPPAAPAKVEPVTPFEDVSDKLGLGPRGIAADLKGDCLLVADVNGDGRQDFLFCAGSGILALNTPRGFVEAKDCGLSFQTGGVRPAFGDFAGDKKLGLFVPQPNGSKLYRNDGQGRFTDVTARSGALAEPLGNATCAAWSDFNKRGRLDLFVGCLRGTNRFFRNNGDGTFADATGDLGLDHRIFNTRGLCIVDINNDGVPDAVFVNEGQESSVLLGDPLRLTAAAGTDRNK